MRLERIIAISDIHGCRLTLEALLKELELRELIKTHRLVFCGDYVDRGLDGVGVLEILRELKSTYPGTVVLRGNHDQRALEGVPDLEGGNLFLGESGHRAYFSFIREMPYYFESQSLVFVHGGVPRKVKSLSELKPHELMWSLGVSRHYVGRPVVHGHVAGLGVRQGANCFSIDSGAAFSWYASLSAAVFEGANLSQVVSVKTDPRDVGRMDKREAG